VSKSENKQLFKSEDVEQEIKYYNKIGYLAKNCDLRENEALVLRIHCNQKKTATSLEASLKESDIQISNVAVKSR